MSGYAMFIGKDQMPVTPGKLTVKIKGKNKSLTLVNDGEINFLKQPGLTEITVDVLLPAAPGASFAEYSGGYKPPDYYLGVFEDLVGGLKTTRFILSRTSPDGRRLFDTNMKVSVESYNIVEDAANGPDITVSLTLKQYKDFGTKTVVIVKPAAAAPVAVVQQPRETDNKPQAKTHTVVKGDCLWAIAQKYMGDGSKYPQLYTANKATIDGKNKGTGNPQYTIYPGQVLVIP